MQSLKFFNTFLAIIFVFFASSCSKEIPTITPSDSSVSIEKITSPAKNWHGNDDDDWLLSLTVRDQIGSPVSYALGILTDINGTQYMSLTDSEGSADVAIEDAVFQYISVLQNGTALEIESAVQNGNAIDVQLK